MAFKNSIKATILLEPEPQQPRADGVFDAPAPIAPPIPVQIVKPKAPGDAILAATWHARAEALCALADTLPCKDSWSLISKIACLYDELARDAGWTGEDDGLPSAELCLEEPQAADEPSPAPLPEPPPPERIAFRRRPLPLGRSFPRRRA